MAFQFMACRGLRSSLFLFSSFSSVGLPFFFSAGFQAGPSVRDGALYDSGGGAKPGRGKGDGHSGRRLHKVGIGYRECGNADGVGDVADYGDGYGCGWGGAWGCGDFDRAVGRNSPPRRGEPRE